MRILIGFVGILITIMSSSSCIRTQPESVSGLQLIRTKELARAVQDYYSYEKSKDWAKSYKLRPPSFSGVVPYELYVKTMDGDNADWELLRYEIKSVSESEYSAEVKIKFDEGVQNQAGGSRRKVSITQATLWIKNEGNWYAEYPGTRGRLTLNNRF